jgi:DNA mismatch repair protein MutS
METINKPKQKLKTKMKNKNSKQKINLKKTTLIKQYYDIKCKYPNEIILFRVGDFYEIFDEDAIKCSKILNIVLTKKPSKSSKQTKFAGFPYYTLDNYLPKLIRAGLRVAICEQIGDKNNKGIIRREVTSLVTPGVTYNENLLEKKHNNFLATIHFDKVDIGLSLLDISTGATRLIGQMCTLSNELS